MSKKLLIREIFEKGKSESGRDSKSGIALYLSLYFYDEWKFEISERTFVRYYDTFLIDNEDKNIDTQTLDKLSQYLDFDDFADFCKNENFTKINEDSSFTKVNVTFDNEDKSFTEKLSQIVVNITTQPIFKFPEFLTKQSNLGIIGIVLCGSFVVGSKMYKADESAPEKSLIQNSRTQVHLPADEKAVAQTVVYIPQSFVDVPVKKERLPEQFLKQCMYWSGKEYIPEECSSTRNGLVAIDMKLIANFKKITTPDTISSIKNVWYSKHENVVEFFTADGNNPENGKELKALTQHMLDKYGNSK